ncbi:MAG: hypothetical protein LAN61_08610 [Acidobacteriia bacterium]|nr:hypothetical protein [Terriglobia bacterium]
MRSGAVMVALLFLAGAGAAQQKSETSPVFHVKYVAEGIVYLDAGRNAGLAEHQVLKIVPPAAGAGASRGEQLQAEEIATIEVSALADASAVCEIVTSTRPLRAGDVAILPPGTEAAAAPASAGVARPYLQVLSFTTGDPLDEEVREALPRQRPLPEINRARGRIGVEYSSVYGRGSTASSNSELGLVLRADMTRLGGSYWNFSGYWRGRLNHHSGSQPQTINDLINRTYQLNFVYNNPYSSLVAGAGRLYLPWASSLDAIDGGYAGLRTFNGMIAGVFAGSTPDPASWDYQPDRRIGGLFVNLERGRFEGLHLISTGGVAISTIGWRAERQFGFAENTLSYKRWVTLYHSMQVDLPHTYTAANPANPATPIATTYGGINRSYLTLRFQPHPRLAFDLNHSYFRGMPTFDPVLIGTGLLDKYLFQGLSGGVRAEVVRHVTLYTSIGRSNRTGDTKPSWNQMYGITLGRVLNTAWRADLRYSRFDSVIGQGSYESLSLSRQLREDLRWEAQAGFQRLNSLNATSATSHFATTQMDWSPGRHLFLQGGFTWQRGGLVNYDQLLFVVGERF